MSITSANRLELLQIADAVAREKMIDPDLVLQAMEESYAKAAKSKYGPELDIRAKIDHVEVATPRTLPSSSRMLPRSKYGSAHFRSSAMARSKAAFAP
mgnify:CR=1 FL=1